jgi:hypothetical protein
MGNSLHVAYTYHVEWCGGWLKNKQDEFLEVLHQIKDLTYCFGEFDSEDEDTITIEATPENKERIKGYANELRKMGDTLCSCFDPDDEITNEEVADILDGILADCDPNAKAIHLSWF